MLIKRVNQNTPFIGLQRDFGRLFDEVFGQVGPEGRSVCTYPALNILENQDGWIVEADVPGLTMDQLNVEVDGNELHIAGKREWETREGETFVRTERASGEFRRTLSLPTDINLDGVDAKLTNGVLSITLPKAETAKPRRIEVRND